MSKYLDETYNRIIWRFTDEDDIEYCVVGVTYFQDENDLYRIFYSSDIEEVAYTNYVVINEYTELNEKIHDKNGPHYVVAKNNYIHCDVGPAICCPCGLGTFKVNQSITDYLLNGRILKRQDWLQTVKNTSSWPEAMANILGAKNS